MRIAEIVTASVIFIVGVAVAIESHRLGAGWGRAGPEAGFYPFWIGVLLALTAAALVAQAAMSGRISGRFLEREKLVLVAKVAVPAVAMVALLHVVGLYVSATLYIAAYMRWIGSYSWAKALAVGAATSIAAFLIFEVWFLTRMPKGPIETWLGY